MKVLALLVFGTVANTVFSATVGETYDQLVAEKGKPKSQITAGDVRLVTYADAKIKLRDDHVISITPIAAPTPAPTSAPAAVPVSDAALPASAPTGTAHPTADAKKDQQIVTAEAGLQKAIDAVQKIVNQPVTPIPITPGMQVGRVSPGWFHDGAITPDFANVDVRKSQELIYDKYPYVASDLNKDVAFEGKDLEFNSMLKLFYTDRTRPKKKLTEREMLQINQLYRQIAQYRKIIQELRPVPPQ